MIRPLAALLCLALLGTACRRDRLAELRDAHGHRHFLEHATLPSEPALAALAFSPDGRWLASLDVEGWIVLRDLREATHRRWQAHARKGQALAFSPDGRHVATCGTEDGATTSSIALWGVAKGTLIQRTGTPHHYHEILFEGPERLLACGWLTSVEAWDPVRGLPLQRFTHPDQDGHLRQLGITPDGFVHALGERHGWVWQDGPGQPPLALSRETDAIPRADFIFTAEGPLRLERLNGRWVLSTPAPRDFQEWRPIAEIDHASLEPSRMDPPRPTPDGKGLLAHGLSGTWYFWGSLDAPPRLIRAEPSSVQAVAIDAQGRRFAYGDGDGRVTLVKIP